MANKNGTNAKINTKYDRHPHLRALRQGTYLSKLRKGGNTFKRFFKLDDEHFSFGYIDSKKSKSSGNTKDQSKLFVNEIQDIQEGPLTDMFVKYFPSLHVSEDQCFSIVIGEASATTLDLIAPDKETREHWVEGLRYLLKSFSESDLDTHQEVWLRELYTMADKNGDETLTFKEVLGVLKHLNLRVDHDHAKELFNKADTDNQKTKKGEAQLNFDEFTAFYKQLTRRPEIYEIFEKYSNRHDYLDLNELRAFYKYEQREELTEDEYAHLMQEFETCPGVKNRNKMSFGAFMTMLNSPYMDIFDNKCNHVYQDMTQPLSHYFIDSSHNTYLAADQLVGPSTVEAYIRALKKGCRCVELDCWDGPEKDEPIIYHGYTLTSKIKMKDVVSAIAVYAFEATEYPLILSIENHLTTEPQKVAAQFFTEIFGDKLHKTPLPDDIECMPSPEELKGKILIKNKKLPSTHEEDAGNVSDEDESIEIAEGDITHEDVKSQLDAHEKKSHHSLARELSDCVTICQSVSFKGFDHEYHPLQNCSIGEKKAFHLRESKSVEWVKHNVKNLTRIYPAGSRTDSSNYHPMPMWLCGNQLVALNYQTTDLPMAVNKGFFLDNGGCGYVLKPDFMRDVNNPFDPDGPFPPEWKKTLTVTIISGCQFPSKKGDRDIIDPFIEVEIVGVEVDNNTQKTEHIQDNGFNPIWRKTFDFEINVPELAMVNFRVFDHERAAVHHRIVAHFSLPFRCIKQGYRTIHLKSKHFEPIWGASLFVNIRTK